MRLELIGPWFMLPNGKFGDWKQLTEMENTMGIEHENADVSAEADQFRETLQDFEHVVTSDTHDERSNRTTIEYVNGEGNAPFIKYRFKLEALSYHTVEEYQEMKKLAAAEAKAKAENKDIDDE